MIEKKVTLRLGECAFPERIRVSQFDTMWRFVFGIVNNSQPWEIPADASAVLNGRKPDGNVFAFSGAVADNKVAIDCDVQMTAVAGQTVCELSILSEGKVVGTANFILDVEAAPKSPDDVSSDTVLDGYGMMGTIAVDGWLNSHSGQIGGLTNEAKQALLTLLTHVAYTDDQGQTYLDALEDALYPPANLVSITAVFNQGENTIYDTDSLDTLKQYLTVTANMSDGTTQTVNNYTLSGTLATGTSTITAGYGGKTATFDVTVTHAVRQYTITNNLTEATNSNNATAINEETAYTATLTANSGYVLSDVTVTMGGTDITETAYDSGTITIASVTGDIVITAVAVEDVGWIADVPYDIQWTNGKSLDTSTGMEKDESGMSVSDFLPCSGLKTVEATGIYNNYGIFYYGEEQNWLAKFGNQNYTIFPCRFNAKYMRVLKRSSSTATVTPRVLPVLSQGVVPTAGEKYCLDILFGKTVWNNKGEEKNASSQSIGCSVFSFCYGFKTLTFSHTVRAWVGFYDADKNFLSSKTTDMSSATVSVPEGATYFRYDGDIYVREWPYVTLGV